MMKERREEKKKEDHNNSAVCRFAFLLSSRRRRGRGSPRGPSFFRSVKYILRACFRMSMTSFI